MRASGFLAFVILVVLNCFGWHFIGMLNGVKLMEKEAVKHKAGDFVEKENGTVFVWKH